MVIRSNLFFVRGGFLFRRLYIIALALCVSVGGYALSGYGISEAASLDTCNPVLHLISPVGGEQWYFLERLEYRLGYHRVQSWIPAAWSSRTA